MDPAPSPLKKTFPRKEGLDVRVIKNMHLGIRAAEDLLRTFECISSGDVRIGRAAKKDILAANDIDQARVLQHPVNIFHGATDDEVPTICPQGPQQVFEGHHTRGIQMPGILEPKDDDLDVRVCAGALNL